MPIITIIVALVVIGLVLYHINTYILMARPIKTVLNVVMVLLLCLWLLNAFGIMSIPMAQIAILSGCGGFACQIQLKINLPSITPVTWLHIWSGNQILAHGMAFTCFTNSSLRKLAHSLPPGRPPGSSSLQRFQLTTEESLRLVGGLAASAAFGISRENS